jgi:regulator of protease activity HflC (stomatin/prohibitin superfamily)
MHAARDNITESLDRVTPVEERVLGSGPGIPVLVGSLAAYLAGVLLISRSGSTAGWPAVALLVLGTVGAAGLTAIKPGEARVVQLFGGYRGTVRTTGLRWVNLFAVRRRVSVRIRNKETPTVKVNDADGNPIEIAARVVPAGVDILEARITRLSYAPEIAQVMLQRQQAGAVIAARSRIVDGAVGMVQMALARLAEEDIVELDEERKAAMVSNLLVVLCGDRGTQPIVNTGSLYQ